MTKAHIELQTMADLRSVVYFLEDLAACLKSGKLCVEHDSQVLLMSPHSRVGIEIRARHHEGKESLEIELRWPHTASASGNGLRLYSVRSFRLQALARRLSDYDW